MTGKRTAQDDMAALHQAMGELAEAAAQGVRLMAARMVELGRAYRAEVDKIRSKLRNEDQP